MDSIPRSLATPSKSTLRAGIDQFKRSRPEVIPHCTVCSNFGLGIASQDLGRIREALQFRKRGARFRILERGLEIEIEAITPRSAWNGAAFNLQQIQVAYRKCVQRGTERSRFVGEV